MLQVYTDLMAAASMNADARQARRQARSVGELGLQRLVRQNFDKCSGGFPLWRDGGALISERGSNVDPGVDALEGGGGQAVADDEIFAMNGMGVELPPDAVEAFECRPGKDQARTWDVKPVNETIIEVVVVRERPLLRVMQRLNKW